jgi:hypothetical protein
VTNRLGVISRPRHHPLATLHPSSKSQTDPTDLSTTSPTYCLYYSPLHRISPSNSLYLSPLGEPHQHINLHIPRKNREWLQQMLIPNAASGQDRWRMLIVDGRSSHSSIHYMWLCTQHPRLRYFKLFTSRYVCAVFAVLPRATERKVCQICDEVTVHIDLQAWEFPATVRGNDKLFTKWFP